MKIISKFVDYYDHMVSKYGYDSTIVYDRRATKSLPFIKVPEYVYREHVFLFSICGEYVAVRYEDKKFTFNPEAKKPLDNKKIFLASSKSSLNVEHRQPILVQDDWGHLGIPRLDDFKFGSFISADEMYQKIYAFLGWLKDNPEPPQITDNKSKILAHGFDLKTSFRPNIKNK